MASVLRFDELNRLNGVRKRPKTIPIDEYFKAMGMSEEDTEERESLAKDLELVFLYIFSRYEAERLAGVLAVAELITLLSEEYKQAVAKYHDLPAELEAYIEYISAEIINTTVEHDEAGDTDPYWTSEDRALTVAENESNTTFNTANYEDALADGKTVKVWVTMGDKRVRPTHVKANGTEVPIGEPFRVGDSLLMFPKDSSLGASDDEIVNCRCWAEYY